MQGNHWISWFAKFALVAAAVLLVAYLSGYPLFVIIAFLAACLAWSLFNTERLLHWLDEPGKEPPKGLGAWSDVYSGVGNLLSKDARRNQRMTSMIEDFQVLADAFPDATLLIDSNNQLLWFNSAAGKSFGLQEDAHTGKPLERLVRIAGFSDWLSQSGSGQAQFENSESGQGESWLECSVIELRDNQRLVVFRDITEVRDTERLRRDFVTNVSHDLRTPLTVMLGYLEMFLDEPPEDVSDAMHRMHTQAVQMQQMLNDFLELSRLQSLESKKREDEINVPGILAALRKQAEGISRGDHEIHFEVREDLLLHGVSEDIESAFQNLLVNALKYTPEGGSVTVRWLEKGGHPRFEVSDSGIGIPAREIPRLTERFYRVGSDRGRKTGGTGLGLSIVKHVLNAHQAQLIIQSEYGRGSTFCCEFPGERKIIH